MYFQYWNSMLITGGLADNDATARTWEFYEQSYYNGPNLNVPRYLHACGSYKDFQKNLQVIILNNFVLSLK